MTAGKQRILIVGASVSVSAAIVARLAQLDNVEVVDASAPLEPVSLKVACTVIGADDFLSYPPWEQANLRAMEGAPFITPSRYQGKQTAQWKRETRNKK